MQTAIDRVERTELPSMAATLCSYESFFGPYHPQTLRLMAEVAGAFWRHGEVEQARALLERAVRDIGRHIDRSHDIRLRSLATLRELLIEKREYESATAVQQELLECCTQRFGADHPDAAAARSELARILLLAVVPTTN